MNVIAAAWAAAGCPGPVPVSGSCARCGAGGVAAAVREAVSGNFTDWDSWVCPAGQGLCGACAWAYREPCLRILPTLVTADGPAIAHPRGADLAAVLAAPVGAGAALVVPLRPGRKHLLPAAAWGLVTVDDASLPWRPGDVARLQAMQRLRHAGFGSRMLAAPAPPYPVLRRLTAGARAAVLADWETLGPWRARLPWLRLAARVTMPPAAGGPPGCHPVRARPAAGRS